MKTLCLILVIASGLLAWYLISEIQERDHIIVELNHQLHVSDQQIKTLEAQIQTLNQQISTLNTELNTYRQQVGNLQADLKERDARIHDMSATIDQLRDESEALNDTLSWVKTKNLSLEAKLANSIELRTVEVKHEGDLAYGKVPQISFWKANPMIWKCLLSLLGLVCSPFVIALGVGIKEKILRGKYRKF